MNNFNLGEVKLSNPTNYLKPYNIYKDVEIKDVETKEGSSPNGNWKSLNITFSCPEGEFTHSLFYVLNDKGFERTSVDMPNGGKREYPSQWERARDTMAAIGFAFFPEDFAKIQSVSAECKTFEQLANLFIKCINKNKGKVKTNMKLVGRNSNGTIYAKLPDCTGIAEAKTEERAASNNVNVGDWYTWMISPFGNNLSFNNYEKGKKSEYENAAPTNMDTIPQTENTEAEIDFDSLL